MKEITINDCKDLQMEFQQYCTTAEQHQFMILTMIDVQLNRTIEKFMFDGKVENQADARAMFRVVLKTIGKDYSEYRD